MLYYIYIVECENTYNFNVVLLLVDVDCNIATVISWRKKVCHLHLLAVESFFFYFAN